ncbi:Nucleotide-binding universal stress protein, UspA family [Actinopolymorpha cephalotaxi]|uniref:Nucleotide-binding universal stress UspA family protein n=1 Tax=Actinopolymorpha cephalotaxi TaxID=504797 RepID=A0A1I2VLT5_9ACTN|nr:universal stress protein [Actinopolymorpha cephalotaxi]NYH83333.1 nucleotide-binding universal stress UspA family protein [Actinopolymorpha cephalotaxi]SFG88466.1 Nucleotide-binding universal stress protein, UspA family [Actinopolymorpha cephalotaxi]
MPRPGNNPAIVVGIDGSDNGLRALDWALEEAAAHRCPVRLVYAYVPSAHRHAERAHGASPRMIAMYEEGREVFAAARAHLAGHRHADLVVGTALYEGAPARVLVEMVSRARMCVVGRRGRSGLSSLLPGSTSMSLAVHARVPLVVVPAQLAANGAGEANGANGPRVVVGVDLPSAGETAVEFAFEEATARGLPLLAVTAWDLADPYIYNPAALAEAVAEREARVTRSLAQTLTPWREKYAEVPVTTLVERSHPVSALVGVSGPADLLVLGGRVHPRSEVVTGSTTRAVVRRVSCPVAVVHDPELPRVPRT